MNDQSVGHRARFPTTHWTRIAAAGAQVSTEDRTALAELCNAYWYPLYVFIRRKGYDAERAGDLTQAYFVRLLEHGVLRAADPHKGRFRAFLRTDCGFFLAGERDRQNAQKRGGGRAIISIDAVDAEGRYRFEPADTLTAEGLFDRAWAATLLEQVIERISRDYEQSGRGALFERLKAVLTDGAEALPYAAIAAELGTTEVAVQSAAQRLRRRFRDLVREQIAATLENPSPESVQDELGDLFAALAQ
jgi:DNA-directed RNA polymerase specialized sigma24 family protein